MDGHGARSGRGGVGLMAPLFFLLMVACAKGQPVAPPPDTEGRSGPHVIFPNGFIVKVEIAADEELRAQGLMYRDSLPTGRGMLFFFPADGEHSFWMRNTRIPLDMIWIDADRRVVHVEGEVPPCRVADCPSYSPGAPARYVLEVAGGVAAEQNLRKGDRLTFVGTESVRPR